mmetsp:Transcript_1256/g.4230  ORF Transcript_1256/g.4230 Transcript_1256/m.4230 type:complete len:526 (-) Transcript_1256:91-1668(-)
MPASARPLDFFPWRALPRDSTAVRICRVDASTSSRNGPPAPVVVWTTTTRAVASWAQRASVSSQIDDASSAVGVPSAYTSPSFVAFFEMDPAAARQIVKLTPSSSLSEGSRHDDGTADDDDEDPVSSSRAAFTASSPASAHLSCCFDILKIRSPRSFTKKPPEEKQVPHGSWSSSSSPALVFLRSIDDAEKCRCGVAAVLVHHLRGVVALPAAVLRRRQMALGGGAASGPRLRDAVLLLHVGLPPAAAAGRPAEAPRSNRDALRRGVPGKVRFGSGFRESSRLVLARPAAGVAAHAPRAAVAVQGRLRPARGARASGRALGLRRRRRRGVVVGRRAKAGDGRRLRPLLLRPGPRPAPPPRPRPRAAEGHPRRRTAHGLLRAVVSRADLRQRRAANPQLRLLATPLHVALPVPRRLPHQARRSRSHQAQWRPKRRKRQKRPRRQKQRPRRQKRQKQRPSHPRHRLGVPRRRSRRSRQRRRRQGRRSSRCRCPRRLPLVARGRRLPQGRLRRRPPGRRLHLRSHREP